MPRIPGTNDRQTAFLRAFRADPAGPPPDHWPAPAILRRWLRKPAFRRALQSVQSALRLQTDFLVVSTAAHAARSLDSPDSSPRIADLLRLAHHRQRFPATGYAPDPDTPDTRPVRDPTSKELDEFAIMRHYRPPLERLPDFPDPVPQDTFYYNILHDPHAILWYMHLYQDRTKDMRFADLLKACKEHFPGWWSQEHYYPHFVSGPPPANPKF
jgi:hypothetical protein